MGKADGTPDEEVGDAGEREKPVEELEAAIACFYGEGEEAESNLDEHAPEWTSMLVNVAEEFRAHASRCERLHRPCATKGGGVGDGEH